MLDFIKIKKKNKGTTIYPDFSVTRKVKDLMVRGGSFYAIWDEEKGRWSTDEFDVQRLVDRDLYLYNERYDNEFAVASLEDNSSGEWQNYKNYIKRMPDNYKELDRKVIFSNSESKKEDYSSRCLPYALVDGPIPSYEKLVSTLYSPEERQKFEWAIGSVIAGDSKSIQKFIVFYGESGSGKSTVMNIIEKLFDGYYSMFEAKSLASTNNSFALEDFKKNPLVAIQHDGDLSKIEDNTKLNSIVSHEKMVVNEKFKAKYEMRFHSFLFMGTNTPVRITDARSGMNRRLIDIHPSNNRLPYDEYCRLVGQIDFELGGIAKHCLDLYLKLGKGYYNTYVPIDMISGTNSFYDYICENYERFKNEPCVTLRSAWNLYKEYADYARIPYPLTLQRFKEELKAYFREYVIDKTVDGTHYRNTYFGFRSDKVDTYSGVGGEKKEEQEKEKSETWLQFEETEKSVFDIMAANYPAQYATEKGTPGCKWASCSTTLKDLSTSQLHYVKVPESHIIIDFDICDKNGEKSLEENLKAASSFPPTYAELSKSGEGIHLHYIYDGDVSQLSRIYGDRIEIKVCTGNASLRRKLSKCVNNQIAHLNSGLPLKGEKMIDFGTLKNERALRTIIQRNLLKEYHGATKPSVDFIFKVLDDAYKNGMVYDVTDMAPAIQAFALNSTHNSEYCIKQVAKMHFRSEAESDYASNDNPVVFFDVEVFPNLFIICWKIAGEDRKVVKMINPTAKEVEDLFKFRLIGFNVRKYDNHILYAAAMGYTNEELFRLSKRIIENSPNSTFREAYNLSYTDIYDFAAKKQSLKKWQIELGIHHQENAYPWDQPVAEEHWDEIADYCCNDVVSEEKVFEHLKGDFLAREILAAIAGGTCNDTTNSLTTRIIFGNDKHPKLVYTDLSELFPGYEFKDGKNLYRGEDIGFGGYIRSWPGIYHNVALLDIASMHPTSAIAMNYFGEYTPRFKAIKDARVAIKRGNLDKSREILSIFVSEEILNKYLSDKSSAKDLAQALKIAINSVYGLTAAKFDNPFRDERNVNNIVALRGALFMKTLRDEIEKKGYDIVAIKTDSIKIAEADEEIIKFCMDFANQYGYEFEHEATYDRICQTNDADYVAMYPDGKWTVTGAQFAHPYVWKTLFSHERLLFDDYCEVKSVQTALYLDLNENLGEDEHNYQFIGRIGSFIPVKPGCGGGPLYRYKDGKYYAAAGSKGYLWLEAEGLRDSDWEQMLDMNYYRGLVDDAIASIEKYGSFEEFVA